MWLLHARLTFPSGTAADVDLQIEHVVLRVLSMDIHTQQ